MKNLSFVQVFPILLFTLLLFSGCVSPGNEQELISQIEQLENELTRIEQNSQIQLEQMESQREMTRKEQERLEEALSAAESQRDGYLQEIQHLERTSARLTERVRTLEALLRELSFATSLVPRSNDLPENTLGGSEPRSSDVTPEMLDQVNALLFELPQYITVPTVFPFLAPGHSNREPIGGSSVFTEMNHETRIQHFFDSRANYSTQASVFPEIRQPLESRASRPSELPQLWLNIQVASDRSGGNLEISGLEFSHSQRGILRLGPPEERVLLQDSTVKLDRVVYAFGQENLRYLWETLTSTGSGAMPSLTLLGKNQRIRLTLQEVEVSALVEMIQVYRELGGPIPRN